MVMMALKFLWQAVLGFVYPPHCMICGKPLKESPGICACCDSEIKHNYLDESEIGAFPMVALTDFRPEIRELIHRLKYGNRTLPGRLMGAALGERIGDHAFLASNPLIVPVPLHAARRRERGYNQSAVIARGLAEKVGLVVCNRALMRVRHTPTQTHLDAAARRENVHDAFVVRQKNAIAGRSVILVDDVVTTGATVLACAEVLRAGGATAVMVCAVAHPVLGQHGT